MADKITCGMRYVERGSEMTCTLERGHEKPVHEMYLNGKFLGGWVDQWREDGTKRLGMKPKEQRPPLDMPPTWRGEASPPKEPESAQLTLGALQCMSADSQEKKT